MDLDTLLVGRSPAIRQLRETIHRLAPRRIPVLIQGPTGAGKDVVARALHLASGRRGPYIAANVAAIAPSLFESEMFGHVRGAFSGAIRSHTGFLRRAEKGTFFLDEIGDLPVAMQVKLLRAIESREIWPVGSEVCVTANFRLVAATNANLEEQVQAGRFRSDLLYRLRGCVLTVPALRDRPEDIFPLAKHCLQHVANAEGWPEVTLTPCAIALLSQHPWPGNIRELMHTLEAAAIEADGKMITEAHLRCVLPGTGSRSTHTSAEADTRRLADLLRKHGFDVDAVAQSLDVDRSTIYRRMRKLGVTGRESLRLCWCYKIPRE